MDYYFPNNKKNSSRFTLIFFIILICLNFHIIYVKAEENRVIKVGYPIVEGFTELDNGTYSGYAFEYLFEISKYTGWQYEFVEMSLRDALNKLQSGEIDIVAGMIKNEKSLELFDFPELNSGYTYSLLATLESNINISRSDYSTLNGITVGYFDKASEKLSKIQEFFEKNDINNVTYKSYPSNDSNALINALNNKEVDAIITGDLLLNNGLKSLAKFDSSPYYFATTKGNTEIVTELNKAISQINEYTPGFVVNLYYKYFDNKTDTSIIFTKEEQEYLSNISTLKAIYIDDFKPLQYYDESTKEGKGIILDIGTLISEKLGVSLELIKADTYTEAYKLIQDNKDYFVLGVPIYYESSNINNIIFTKSYLDLDIVRVYSKKAPSNKEDQILALPHGYGYPYLNAGYKIKYYDTMEDCLAAVEKNEASFTYGNYYTISSYIADNYFSNLSVVPDSNFTQISCAVSADVDKTLFNILNKVIASISDEDVKSFIYNNSTAFEPSVSFKSFFLSNLALCLTLILIILFIIALLISIIIRLKFKDLKRKKNLLLSKSQIDQLSGLYNRNTCEELVSNYLDTRNLSLYYSFIIMDIDYFKQVNDKFGHQAGDILLKEFSQLLKEFFSKKDIICRWGGDEFIIFIKDINENNLNIVNEKLQKLCQIMNKKIEYNGDTQKISISVGSVITNQINAFDKLYHKADEALYEVKRNGRNGFKIREDF
jgi:diguanylate cyclase (GGDEF)-like protein